VCHVKFRAVVAEIEDAKLILPRGKGIVAVVGVGKREKSVDGVALPTGIGLSRGTGGAG
jgi:hypothetical protein